MFAEKEAMFHVKHRDCCIEKIHGPKQKFHVKRRGTANGIAGSAQRRTDVRWDATQKGIFRKLRQETAMPIGWDQN